MNLDLLRTIEGLLESWSVSRVWAIPITLCLMFVSAAPAAAGQTEGSSSTAPRAVALTLDDLPKALPPGESVNDLDSLRTTTHTLLSVLTRHHAPAIGFVNEQRLYVKNQLDARIAVLEMWLEAGMMLGNHSFAHARFQETPLSQYEDDAIRGEVVTRPLMGSHGLAERYYRYPFNSTGPTRAAKESFEAFLRERGYRIAPFTIENVDYAFNQLYFQVRKANDAALAERLRAAYLDHTDAAFGYFEKLSRQMFGREIPQVLLIHANDLNADCLHELLRRLEQRGYRFISLDEALQDPAYKTPDEYAGPYGISWMHRWKIALGMKLSYEDEPDPPAWVIRPNTPKTPGQ